MQTQQTITNAPVHVKVAMDNEFRRFLLTPITFEHLHNTLKALFSVDAEFTIKFQDDENDWVLVTTDQELVYATELSGSPLRLQVKLLSSETPAHAGSLPVCERGRGRGCRGRGKGAGRGGCKSPEEKLCNKSSRLTERINQLETKINSNNLPSDRERVLRWRLCRLQEKLEFVKAMHSDVAPQQSEPALEAQEKPSDVTVEEREKPCFRGGRHGRGGRGGCRRAMHGEGVDRPRKCLKGLLPPEIIANFRQCKANLRAARESGNTEEIQACLEALQVAKAKKWEAIDALRAKSSNDEEKA